VSSVPARSPRNWLGLIAIVLLLPLVAMVALQTYMLSETRDDLERLQREVASERDATRARTEGLDGRTKELERRAGNTLDAQAVASEVLPSVFRVIAGQFTGTAFAFGNETPEGGTQFLTNYHVVESVFDRGGREVALEQKNRRFTAQIVKVDERVDLALLVSTEKFPRLQPAPEPARAGQSVVVVGAPLGLNDTVTSGVVSALRDTPRGQVLQFDASVNPGNSGGPIVNAQRQVVGVVNAKLDKAEGISLGIPVGVVCQTLGLC
jgi:putative serine protease PepD